VESEMLSELRSAQTLRFYKPGLKKDVAPGLT
jgi:hypothetical protein